MFKGLKISARLSGQVEQQQLLSFFKLEGTTGDPVVAKARKAPKAAPAKAVAAVRASDEAHVEKF